jgi:hypothetical protein
VHDRHTGPAGRVDQGDGVGEHAGPLHDTGDRRVQHAALTGELVLVLDEHDRGPGRVEFELVRHGDTWLPCL